MFEDGAAITVQAERAQQRDALSAADAAALILLGLRTDPRDGQGWDRSWGN